MSPAPTITRAGRMLVLADRLADPGTYAYEDDPTRIDVLALRTDAERLAELTIGALR